MPSKNQTSAAYTDCYKIMDQALSAGGIRVQFPDRTRATVFRHRCYKARSLLYHASAKAVPAGVLPSTPYDDVLIRFESDFKEQGDTTALVFLLRSKQEVPAVTDLDGNPLVPRQDFVKLDLPGISLDD